MYGEEKKAISRARSLPQTNAANRLHCLGKLPDESRQICEILQQERTMHATKLIC
jgi:hypothetical protein